MSFAREILKKAAGWAAFAAGILGVSLSYAALSSGLTTADLKAATNQLSSASWNRIVNSVLELDARTATISTVGGNVGIWTASPSATLDVNGSVKIGGQKIARITTCAWASDGGIASPNGTSYFHYGWKNSDCSNGLPLGNCTGFLAKNVHSGSDQDWEVLNPGETNYNGSSFVNGGMTWWTSSPGSAVRIRATYFCDQ